MIEDVSLDKKFFGLKAITWLFILAFVGWMVCFRDFLLVKLYLTSDAMAYRDTVYYFSSSLARVIYPLWEHGRADGVVFEFFLRRIGSFNPVFMFVALLQNVGVNFHFAYLTYLTGYFFIGAIGFYKLAKLLFSSRAIAFVSFLLLLYSSWGTRLFDSYIYLTLVPLIWFFYFTCQFLQNPRRRYLLGAVFAMILLLTTYLPFFTISILLIVAILAGCFYPCQFGGQLKEAGRFLFRNKLFAIGCVALLLVYAIPGAKLFLEAKQGSIVLNDRQYQGVDQATQKVQLTDTAFEVDLGTITSWGIEEDLLYSLSFLDVRFFKFAVVYVPIVIVIILLLGMFCRLEKLTLLLGALTLVGFLLFAHRFPIYPFLYEHVFYFKFFRNLHFFLWFMLIPVFILFATSQIKSITHFCQKFPVLFLSYSTVIHFLLVIFAVTQKMGTMTLSAVFLSAVFWTIYSLSKKPIPSVWMMATFLVVALAPSVEVYSFLQKNSEWLKLGEIRAPFLEGNQQLYRKAELRLPLTDDAVYSFNDEGGKSFGSADYYALAHYDFLIKNVDSRPYRFYIQRPLYLFDQVEQMNENNFQAEKVENAFKARQNVAFVADWLAEDELYNQSSSKAAHSQLVLQNSSEVTVQRFSEHDLVVKTNFKMPKFFVYNDSYHKNWHVWIDHKPAQLRRANIAYKGVWIPAGEHVVKFRFGAWHEHLLNWILLLGSYAIFLTLLSVAIYPRLKGLNRHVF